MNRVTSAVVFAWVASAVAQQPPADERAVRLEQRVRANADRIESLERQLTTDSAGGLDAARIEQMRAQIRAVLGAAAFRESLMPAALTAGYDGGFFIRDSGGSFSMNFNGVMQLRWTHYATRADNRWLAPRTQRDDRTGFDLQRLRFTIGGFAFDPDLTYGITLRADAPDSQNVRLHYGWVNYRFDDAFQVRAGVFRVASTRVQFQSDEKFNFVDRPMTDAVFGLGIGTGVRFWGELCNKRLYYYLDVVNELSSPDDRVISPDPSELDATPAILARLVWRALGPDPRKDFAVDPDLPPHDTPALDFGFHYAFDDNQGDNRALRIPFPLPRPFGRGGFGLTTSNGLQINQFGFDAGFKYAGLSVVGEYILRIQDVRRAGRTPYTPLWLLTGDDSTNVQHGAYVGAGYFLPIPGFEKRIEAVTRIGGISTLAGGQEGTWEYTGGINYYLAGGSKTKLQFDVTKVSEVPISNSASSLATVNDDALVFRVQMQMSF